MLWKRYTNCFNWNTWNDSFQTKAVMFKTLNIVIRDYFFNQISLNASGQKAHRPMKGTAVTNAMHQILPPSTSFPGSWEGCVTWTPRVKRGLVAVPDQSDVSQCNSHSVAGPKPLRAVSLRQGNQALSAHVSVMSKSPLPRPEWELSPVLSHRTHAGFLLQEHKLAVFRLMKKWGNTTCSVKKVNSHDSWFGGNHYIIKAKFLEWTSKLSIKASQILDVPDRF